MSDVYAEYTVDYIAGVMSLRAPQRRALEILDGICRAVEPRKGMDLGAALAAVRALHPTCTDFERGFMSLAFALATGVGKTRLMGAFIAYLFTRRDVRNFFVVAPNTTIYEKLRCDLGEPCSAKYVFRGLGCFAARPPEIVAGDDYRHRPPSLFASDVRIFICNIDKFNKEGANMRRVSEALGESFCAHLASLPDLVLLMDESHHYRATRGLAALDDLRPLLGLELTATPQAARGARQVPFRNVVLDYPLARAIADGYTRTPYAVTRANVVHYDFGDEQMDRMMLNDGALCHERAKAHLAAYAANTGRRVVKPFMLVVCRDTDHARRVADYVTSAAFRGGAYRGRTLVVHSRQTGAETEANTRLLLGVERADNPVEIVIHVNMLKEGWDVDNLYTIVPLRTAASKILREQMVGRGLRLPYGARTGDADVDAVMLTAHDKFEEILEEARRGDSIFRRDHLVALDPDEPPERVMTSQPALPFDPEGELAEAYAATRVARTDGTDALFGKARTLLGEGVADALRALPEDAEVTEEQTRAVARAVAGKLAEDRDLGDVYRANEFPLKAWLRTRAVDVLQTTQKKFIPIPRIKVTDAGVGEVAFEDFDLDLSAFTDEPIRNELLAQSLEDPGDLRRVAGDALDFEGWEPRRALLHLLRQKPEVDYERDGALLKRLVTRVCDHYRGRHGENGLRNIVMMERRDVAERIYRQLLRHMRRETGVLHEEVEGMGRRNAPTCHACRETCDFFSDGFTSGIASVLFTGIRKGVFGEAKFDSRPELAFARLVERDAAALNWLRPAPSEFSLSYGAGRVYEPDFVVETREMCYLVEVKGEDRLDDADVRAKTARGVCYCAAATRWCEANGRKPWRYLLIPSKRIEPAATFERLARTCAVT